MGVPTSSPFNDHGQIWRARVNPCCTIPCHISPWSVHLVAPERQTPKFNITYFRIQYCLIALPISAEKIKLKVVAQRQVLPCGTISRPFWTTVCKTVHPYVIRCLYCPVCLSVCLSVCNIGVLWPNGWTDQHETWHGGRPRLRRYCVRWGPSTRSPSPKGAQPPPIFGPYLLWQMARRWIKIPLGRKAGLDPSDIVLDGDTAPPP